MANIRRVAPILFNQRQYWQKVKSLFGTSLIAYFPLDETSGTVSLDKSGNGRNGAYTGVDLNNISGPHGKGAPLFGTGDLCNIYTAGLGSAFNGAEGTILIWDKVLDAGVWTDGAIHKMIQLRADLNNLAAIIKSATNNEVYMNYVAGGTIKERSQTSSSLGWNLYGISWSKSANQVIFWENGVAVSTQPGPGTWAGALASTVCIVGATNTAAGQPWAGWLSNAIILNRAATVPEVSQVFF